MTKNHRVLIIDDHPLFREGLAALINGERDMKVCAEVGDPQQAIAVVQKNKPDVVTLDLSLHGSSGIDVLNDLKDNFPELKVLVISMCEEAVYAPRILRAGAMGYVMKEDAPEKVLLALRQILTNQIYLSPATNAKMLHTLAGKPRFGSPFEILSGRQLEVFTLLGQGRGTREIANKLKLSVKTVEAHRANIMQKLHLENSSRLVQHAVHWVCRQTGARP